MKHVKCNEWSIYIHFCMISILGSKAVVHELRIQGCRHAPCILKKGVTYKVELDVESRKLCYILYIFGIWLNHHCSTEIFLYSIQGRFLSHYLIKSQRKYSLKQSLYWKEMLVKSWRRDLVQLALESNFHMPLLSMLENIFRT